MKILNLDHIGIAVKSLAESSKLYELLGIKSTGTVAEKLKELKYLKKIGGKAFLSRLANEVPTSANVESYGRIIKSLSAKRELISAAGRISERSFDGSTPSAELLDYAEQEIFSLSQKHLKTVPVSLKEVLTASFDRLDELQKTGNGMRGIPSGFVQLDSMLAGMQDSNLIVMAARPGVGKTAFALNIARYVAVEKKMPTCFFSLEMSKEELVDRLLVRQGLIDAWKLKTGQLSETDFDSLSEAMGVLAEAPLYIDDMPGLTVTELRTKARRLQMDKGIRFIVVDYLQLMHGTNRENRVQEVSEISQGLKNLARELKLPILAVAQLNRQMESRGGKPKLSDLRESGSIEQDADVVMFLHREDEEVREMVTCSIEKHRNGPTGQFNLYFNGKQVSFFDVDKKS